MSESKFKVLAQEVCNGCDLVTTEENKLTTDDVVEAGTLTLDDFATCEIEGEKVGVVTFVEMSNKYYWGGKALTNMVTAFINACGSEIEARAQYAKEKEKIKLSFELVKTKAKQDFVKVTVL